MALLSRAQIQQARQSGYSDAEILAYLTSIRSDLAERFQEAAREGYTPSEIVSFLVQMDCSGGSRTTPQKALESDPLAVLDKVDSSLRPQVEVFTKVLSATVAMVIPRGAPDPCLPGDGIPWKQWKLCQLDRIFREGRRTSDQIVAFQAREKEDRKASSQRQRRVQRGWVLLVRLMKKNRSAALALRAQYATDETPLLLRLAERGMRGVNASGERLWRQSDE
jgi:hypothetical protein